jgi:alkylation response protein AidB-like acyl-CoA dehydrogenase
MDFSLPEELKMLQTLARDFVKEQLIPLEKEVLGRESDLEGARRTIPPETEVRLIETARQIGLWGLSIPENLGGAGIGVLGTCLVEEEMSRTVLPFHLGDVSPILYDCNEEQKHEYLLPLLKGTKSAYLALIEPGKGFDPGLMEMEARKADGGFELRGKKIIFSSRNKADFAIVFAVTDREKGLREGVTCFLVDCDTPGCSVAPLNENTGWRALTSQQITITFEGCNVPVSAMLGEEGKAFSLGRKQLEARRIVRGARCVGAATRLLEKAAEHAASWTSYGQTAAVWPSVRASLAEMAVEIQAARLMVYQAACKADQDQDIRVSGAMVKVFTKEMLKRAADKSVLVRSGPGPVQGLPLEFLCRSFLMRNIEENALEVQKSAIAAELLKVGAGNFSI